MWAVFGRMRRCVTVALWLQTVFQLRVRPECYSVGLQTLGAQYKDIDRHFKDSELEWYTKEAGSVYLTGILVRVAREGTPWP